MYEIEQDRYIDVAIVGFGFDPCDLVGVAVHQRDPGALVDGVSALGFVEDAADHFGGIVDNAGGEPLVSRLGRGRAFVRVRGCDHVVWAADAGRSVVYGADLGHALSIAFLALGQAR